MKKYHNPKELNTCYAVYVCMKGFTGYYNFYICVYINSENYEKHFCLWIIIRYYSKINGMYRNPSLAQCLLSMLVLCVVMFMANVGLEQDITLFFKMCCFLCAAGFQIVIYCYNGQKIITQVNYMLK